MRDSHNYSSACGPGWIRRILRTRTPQSIHSRLRLAGCCFFGDPLGRVTVSRSDSVRFWGLGLHRRPIRISQIQRIGCSSVSRPGVVPRPAHGAPIWIRPPGPARAPAAMGRSLPKTGLWDRPFRRLRPARRAASPGGLETGAAELPLVNPRARNRCALN